MRVDLHQAVGMLFGSVVSFIKDDKRSLTGESGLSACRTLLSGQPGLADPVHVPVRVTECVQPDLSGAYDDLSSQEMIDPHVFLVVISSPGAEEGLDVEIRLCAQDIGSLVDERNSGYEEYYERVACCFPFQYHVF